MARLRADLEGNLRDLHRRVHCGGYRAKPTRRAYIPKHDGRLRPLGIAALEDKILQRAVVEVLNGIYETDFLGFSYGFRPGRSAHDALDALAAGIYDKKVNWVLDADIRDFFTSIDHSWLLKFLEHRIADRRVLRLIQKWLSAGVIEDGKWSETLGGTAQGASASPLLANVYLHYVFDLWAQDWRGRHAGGDVIIVRYADDYIVGFQHQRDAQRFLADLRGRLAMFGLGACGREDPADPSSGGLPPRTASPAGSASRKRSTSWVSSTLLKDPERTLHAQAHHRRQTDAGQAERDQGQLKRRRHLPLDVQGKWLGSVVRGHMAYYAVPGNSDAIIAFHDQVTRHWLRALQRRSQRSQPALVSHDAHRCSISPTRPTDASLPQRAISRQHPRQEPGALTRTPGSVRGAAGDGGPYRHSKHGTAYGRFLRALDSGNEVLILSAARQLPRVALNDALRICLVLRDGDPDRYERAAVRWLGRFALEARDVTVNAIRGAAEALDDLPDQPAEAMERLQRLCIIHGLS